MSYVVETVATPSEKSASAEISHGGEDRVVVQSMHDILPQVPAYAMRAIGVRSIGERRNINACRYVFLSTLSGFLWALQNWSIFYGLGLHPVWSAVLLSAFLVPVTFLSSNAEVQIFSSQFLARHLSHNSAELKAKTKSWI